MDWRRAFGAGEGGVDLCIQQFGGFKAGFEYPNDFGLFERAEQMGKGYSWSFVPCNSFATDITDVSLVPTLAVTSICARTVEFRIIK